MQQQCAVFINPCIASNLTIESFQSVANPCVFVLLLVRCGHTWSLNINICATEGTRRSSQQGRICVFMFTASGVKYRVLSFHLGCSENVFQNVCQLSNPAHKIRHQREKYSGEPRLCSRERRMLPRWRAENPHAARA